MLYPLSLQFASLACSVCTFFYLASYSLAANNLVCPLRHVMHRVKCRPPESRPDSSAQGGGVVATMPPRHTEILRGLWIFYGDIWGPAPISISFSNGFSNSTRQVSESQSPDLSASISPSSPYPHESPTSPRSPSSSPAYPQVQPFWLSPNRHDAFSLCRF